MLSNTAETKPSPKAVCHDAAGRCSTGIIEAVSTRHSRKIVPRSVAGNTLQSGRRRGAAVNSAIHTAAPSNGRRSVQAGNRRLLTTLTVMASPRVQTTTPTRPQSTRTCSVSRRTIGDQACCCRAAGMPNTTSATPAAM
jgi:hypothetical protein